MSRRDAFRAKTSARVVRSILDAHTDYLGDQ